MIFFTADTHFWHSGIIPLCRPWATSVEHMNAQLIENWNTIVRSDDTVYHLGDLSFAGTERTVSVVGQLNGRIKLIPGNHDEGKIAALSKIGLIDIAPELLYWKHEGIRAVLCHYPLLSWRNMAHGSWMLHGHSHGTMDNSKAGKRMDVGIDAMGHGFPIPLEFIVEYMKNATFVQVDHHKEHHASL